MLERIEISVIPQDLRQEETIVQIAEALDNLDFAVSHIFNSLNERIFMHTKRLGVIRTRATKLQKQLEYLQNNLNLKAIKLYSAAKYPANHTYNEYKLVIQPKSRIKIPSNTIYKSPVSISDKSDSVLISNSKIENRQYTSNLNIQEKLQFYYVKSKPSKKTKIYIEKNQTREYISSIDSLLLYNANDCRASVNLQFTQNEEKNQIQDAPNSILQPWHPYEIEYPSRYLYAPTLGEVPPMNVPLMLPHLPGIVDDERFSLDLSSQSPIAPSSVVVTPTIRNDPLSLETSDQYNKKLQANEKVSCNVHIGSNTFLSLAIVAKNVTEQLPGETSLKVITSVSDVTSQSPLIVSPPPPPPSPPPPPPPPPPPLQLSPPLPLEYKQETKPVKIIKNSTLMNPNSADDRCNLMAAIRDAGGLGKAKLKHTVLADKTKDRWSSASVGGDLMADLHATLSLRRKGIAGSAINALVRMSSMIPPPPKPNESSTSDRNSAASECESQDDDGWEE